MLRHNQSVICVHVRARFAVARVRELPPQDAACCASGPSSGAIAGFPASLAVPDRKLDYSVIEAASAVTPSAVCVADFVGCVSDAVPPVRHSEDSLVGNTGVGALDDGIEGDPSSTAGGAGVDFVRVPDLVPNSGGDGGVAVCDDAREASGQGGCSLSLSVGRVKALNSLNSSNSRICCHDVGSSACARERNALPARLLHAAGPSFSAACSAAVAAVGRPVLGRSSGSAGGAQLHECGMQGQDHAMHDARNSVARRGQGPTRRWCSKGGVSGPAEDLRPVSEVEAWVNFRSTGRSTGASCCALSRAANRTRLQEVWWGCSDTFHSPGGS